MDTAKIRHNLTVMLAKAKGRGQEGDEDFVEECKWLINFIDGTISEAAKSHLDINGIRTVEEAANWIGFNLNQEEK